MCCCLFASILSFPVSKHNQKSSGNQQLSVDSCTATKQIPFELLARPIKFTRSGIGQFIKQTYNHSAYGQKFLAFNFFHSITLLGYACQSSQPRAYSKSVFRLFGQKLKSVQYINTFALLELLDKLPDLLKQHCADTQERSNKKELIKQHTYDFLLNQLDYLKENPEEALEQFADKIYTLTSTQTNCAEQDCTSAELQEAIAQFLEISISKLIWSHYDQVDIWRSVKLMGQQLETLTRAGLLKNSEVLDELYWTLITRFCYFLELSGTELNQEFYQVARHDIIQEKELLWSLPEQEAFITPKKKYLERALLAAQTKARAYTAGLVSNCVTVN